jgi:phospholipid/cholesterol/gamma-HCH transport system substrate-binding protein
MSAILRKVDTSMDRLNAGQGTLGQLMVNPQLYDSLTGVTREVNSLLVDVHKNPKKFLTIRLTLF